MAKVVNFGSLNLDNVYRLEHFVRAGETVSAAKYDRFSGGKGLNQSIALARAGCEVCHVGKVGSDGRMLVDMLRENGVNTEAIWTDGSISGHAVIQVDGNGQNSIIVYGGANHEITREQIDSALALLEPGDIVLLQNEINDVDKIMKRAKEKGARIALNPSPIDSKLLTYPIHLAEWLIFNEIEGAYFCHAGIEEMAAVLSQKYPDSAIVLTLGNKGVVYADQKNEHRHGIYDVPVVDTTAAGDTFVGFFIASIIRGKSVGTALKLASQASAIAVSRAGAAESIPTLREVLACGLALVE